MPRVNFTAPTTVDEAVKALASAAGLAKVLSGGTDLLVQLRSGPAEARPDRRHQADPRPDRHPRGGRQLRHRRRDARASCSSDHEALEHAWPGIVEGVDLIGSTADPGPRLARRQSVQRLAGRRQRAGGDRRARDRRHRRPERPARGAGRGDRHRARAAPRSPRASSSSSSACRSRSRVSRDAYLRFIPRTEMDIAVVGCGVNVTLDAGGTCTDARVVLGAVAPTQLIVDDAAEALIGHKLDDATLAQARRRGAGAPASRSPTSAARSNTAPRSPACSRAGRPPSPSSAPRRVCREDS